MNRKCLFSYGQKAYNFFMNFNQRHFINRTHSHYRKERYLLHQKRYGHYQKPSSFLAQPERSLPCIPIETRNAFAYKRSQKFYKRKRYAYYRHAYGKIHNKSQRHIVFHAFTYEAPVIPVQSEIPQVQPVTPAKKKHTGIYIVLLLIAVIVCLLGILIHTISSSHSEVTSTPEAAASTPDIPVETPVPSPTLRDTLQPQLESMISSLEGEWSIYVKDLSSNEEIIINDHKGHSASLIKLFTAGRYEQAIRDGELQETDAGDYNEALMISNSDNDAWVNLETIIGHGSYRNGYTSVTQFARNEGFSSTGRLVDQNDNWNGNGGMNWTSVRDVGTCLDEIYHGTYVSADASEKILNLMKQQSHLNKIPAGLPAGTVCANKTGELDLTQNDAAIVYGPKTNYILVVMSDGMHDGNQAINEIIQISETVWNTMEN